MSKKSAKKTWFQYKEAMSKKESGLLEELHFKGKPVVPDPPLSVQPSAYGWYCVPKLAVYSGESVNIMGPSTAPPPYYPEPSCCSTGGQLNTSVASGGTSDESYELKLNVPVDPSVPSPKAWTSDNAKAIINWFQLVCKPLGYHMCLGGSVLNKGFSEKDLDLYFLPLGSHTPTQPVALVQWFTDMIGKLEPIGDNYPGSELPYAYKGKLNCSFSGAQRIDVFIMGTAADAEAIAATQPTVVNLSGHQIDHSHTPTATYPKLTEFPKPKSSAPKPPFVKAYPLSSEGKKAAALKALDDIIEEKLTKKYKDTFKDDDIPF